MIRLRDLCVTSCAKSLNFIKKKECLSQRSQSTRRKNCIIFFNNYVFYSAFSAGSARDVFLLRLCRAVPLYFLRLRPCAIRGEMAEPSRNIDRKKVYTGVGMLCAAVLLMLVGQESTSPVFQVLWILLLGIGLLFYLWGRFFSRRDV